MAQGGLGPLVRRLRQRCGLTQEELADRSGLSTRAISDMERGVRSRIYRDTAERLAVALELTASDRRQLLDAARRQITDPFPPVPIPPSPMIGRERDVAEVRERLRHARLVTLTGPGGIGKTRLAVEVARTVDPFPDGTCFVALAEADEPRVVPGLVARALGVPGVRHLTGAELGGRLGSRHLLLVLDTFEHVLDAAPFVADLLAHAAGVTVLATSRAPLRLRGETEFAVRPLEPDDAAELFAARARSARPGAVIEPADARPICERVDCVPLAIELAAARVRHLTVAALRDGLDAGLDLLSGGARDLPPRQRAMRDTIAWSYDLLGAPAQTLFRDLHVFAGATVAAVQEVCPAVPDVVTELSTLVEHSLLRLIEPDGRYVMFDVVREHAARRSLALGEAAAARSRHLRHFVGLVERAEPHLRGPRQLAWHQRLDAELPNLRLAFSHACLTGDAEAALRLAGAAWMFWLWHGGFAEGRDWLAAALELGGGPRERGKALWGSGWLAYHQADDAHTVACGRQLVAESARTGNVLDERNGLTLLGMSDLAAGRAGNAVRRFQRCLEICRRHDDPWLLATSTLNLGAALLHGGDVPGAERMFADAQARYAELGDGAYWARATRYRAAGRLVCGELRSADVLLRSCVPDAGGDWGMAETLTLQAAVCAAAGDARRAGAAMGAADRLRERLSTRPHPFDAALAERYLAAARTSVDWARGYAEGRDRPWDGSPSGAPTGGGRTEPF